MTDLPPPERTAPPDPADGEVLSAYLAGDLDEEATAALEERLADDPELARRLDATADVMMSLRGVDEVAMPPDAGRRLRDGLRPAPDAAADATVTALGSRRRVSWSAIGGVAAGLAAVALIGGGLLQGFGTGVDSSLESADGGSAGEQAVPEAMEDSVSEEAETEAFGQRDRAADEDASAPEPSAVSPADGPVLLDEEVALPSADAVAARYQGLPEVDRLLGEPVAAATDRAAAYRSAVVEAPAWRSGTRPGDCLDETAQGEPVIPARVESVVFEGRPAVAYVLVSAGAGSSTLDRAQAWIVDPADCTARLVLDLP